MISLSMSALIQLCDTNSVPMYNGHIYTSSVFQNVVPQSYSSTLVNQKKYRKKQKDFLVSVKF